MSKNRRTKVKFPVYNNYTITVIEARNLVLTGQRLNCEISPNDGAMFIEHPTYSLRSWLLFEPNPSPGYIAHEASHAIRAMFNSVGVRNDDETFAYHHGHLVERLHKFLKKEG